ncbi:DUF4276 family protein [Kitasatospora phosalacinea]|uniref:DUF4276 family protein n=1 Tax=Kitasatospora phosalacinea TaxID=2065 RepID=UPI0005267C12|nr:DUF4276 family protein [Kitasatospora phosalacinea]
MTFRVLFTGEGSSDDGLVRHIEAIVARAGRTASVTSPDFGRLSNVAAHSVPDKLRVARKFGDDYDLIAIHRDADRAGVSERREEIAEAVASEWPNCPHIAVVPVRMLEAWLLLDEALIRQVAENPKGRVPLNLPKGASVEKVADPKKLLKDSLATASGYSGRRLEGFQKRFPQHRHKLLERLDPYGPVSLLPSWQTFVSELTAVVGTM